MLKYTVPPPMFKDLRYAAPPNVSLSLGIGILQMTLRHSLPAVDI